MRKSRITFKEAVRFHGHLGPYLILGVLAGELALKKLEAEKYSGLSVKVFGANKKPKSCLIDGLQLAAGATYGKGNIIKSEARSIRILFCNLKTKKKIEVSLRTGLIKRLNGLLSHRDSEEFAKRLYHDDSARLFKLRINI